MFGFWPCVFMAFFICLPFALHAEYRKPRD